jgi:hypothetical protein
MCVFIKLLGLEYDQGPLAFIKELLLLGNVFKAWLLQTLVTHKFIQTNNTINKKQYTKQYKQSKITL